MNCSGEVIRHLQSYVLESFFHESLNTNVDLDIFQHFVILCTCNTGHYFFNDMQTNYVMEYLNGYHENANIINIKFVFEVYV